jgi:hypothetical protein
MATCDSCRRYVFTLDAWSTDGQDTLCEWCYVLRKTIKYKKRLRNKICSQSNAALHLSTRIG